MPLWRKLPEVLILFELLLLLLRREFLRVAQPVTVVGTLSANQRARSRRRAWDIGLLLRVSRRLRLEFIASYRSHIPRSRNRLAT